LAGQEIPEHVRAFLSLHIDSVVQLELLLYLYKTRGQRWDANALAKELRIDPAWTRGQLEHLCGRKLLACEGSTYQFQPQDPALDQAVHDLDLLYLTHRVSVIGLIFAKPLEKIRSFADAFKLRKDKPDG